MPPVPGGIAFFGSTAGDAIPNQVAHTGRWLHSVSTAHVICVAHFRPKKLPRRETSGDIPGDGKDRHVVSTGAPPCAAAHPADPDRPRARPGRPHRAALRPGDGLAALS